MRTEFMRSSDKVYDTSKSYISPTVSFIKVLSIHAVLNDDFILEVYLVKRTLQASVEDETCIEVCEVGSYS